MKISFRRKGAIIIGLLFVFTPPVLHAQSGPPPVGAQTVREGDFAVALTSALGLGTTDDEVEAETRLGQIGIAPRNGWIADYPVTPDVMGELQNAVSDAALGGRLSVNRDEALRRLNDVDTQMGLAISPYTGSGQPQIAGAENYPDPAAINNYYYDEGPPVITYYAPPPDFYYLYAWIPFPFWCGGFWFPGYFILHDFHRTIFFHHRAVFLSNHFNDITAHRVFRIDPMGRYNGRTFAGVGAPRSGNFISTGVPGAATRVFHAPHERMAVPNARTVTPPFRRGGSLNTPSPAERMAGPAPRTANPSLRGGSMGGAAPRANARPVSRGAPSPSMRSGSQTGGASRGGSGAQAPSHGGGRR